MSTFINCIYFYTQSLPSLHTLPQMMGKFLKAVTKNSIDIPTDVHEGLHLMFSDRAS